MFIAPLPSYTRYNIMRTEKAEGNVTVCLRILSKNSLGSIERERERERRGSLILNIGLSQILADYLQNRSQLRCLLHQPRPDGCLAVSMFTYGRNLFR
jgi:hypothetical protein